MIALDTNILVYAHRADMPQHHAALRALATLSSSGMNWRIPWPCIHEFIAIVTGPVFKDSATPLTIALNAIDSWLGHPNCKAIGEGHHHLGILSGLMQRADLKGGGTHDARIAAICIAHNIDELWSADRDFSRFPDLRIRNPLVASLHEPVSTYSVG